MKVAITGKGGTGKTTVAAILARSLARAGERVVAIDADPTPNLGIALGLGSEATAQLEAIANRLLAEKAAHQRSHDHDHDEAGGNLCDPPPGQAVRDLVAEVGVDAPDGVRLIQTGKVERPADGCMCCGSHGTTRKIFGEIDSDGSIVIADLEAGVNDLIWVYPKPEDVVLIVTEPYRKSIEVARRALRIVGDLSVGRVVIVANRVESPGDTALVRSEFPGVHVVEVPEDPLLTEADRRGSSPMDVAPQSPGVQAVARLTELFESEHSSR